MRRLTRHPIGVKPVFSLLFVLALLNGQAAAKHLVYAEYFFDTDPGQEHGTAITPCDGVFDEPQEEFCATGIPTPSLADGRHTLFLRLKDSENNWGMRRMDFFVVSSSPYAQKTITAAEYRIDAGSWAPLPALDGQFDEPVELLMGQQIESSALTLGLHKLYVRVRDSYNVWSTERQVAFRVDSANTNKHLVDAEYFIDTDPGQGMATLLPAKDGTWSDSKETSAAANVSTSGLSPGPHTVSARFKDNWSYWPQFNGWGPVTSKLLWVKGDFSISGDFTADTCTGVFTPMKDEVVALRLDSLGTNIMCDTTNLIGEYSFHGLIDTTYYIVLPEWDTLYDLVVYRIEGLRGDSVGLSIRQYCGGIPTDILETDARGLQTTYLLWQNYPNPFNPVTVIQFGLPARGFVTVDLYNILGQKVATLIDGKLEAGEHIIHWDGKGSDGQPLASGIYFYRLTAAEFVETRKMVLLK